MNSESGVYGIVLASGQSIRMGKPKLLLPWKEVPLLEHLLIKMSILSLDETKIVIPSHSKTLKQMVSSYNCQPIYNEAPHLGMGHSLALAFHSLPLDAEAALILLGDQPALHTNDMWKVLLAFKQIRSKRDTCPKVIIQMKYSNGKAGHPTLFSSHFFKELKSLKGDIGGKGIIEKNHHFLFQCPTSNDYPGDIDTPSEYSQLIEERKSC